MLGFQDIDFAALYKAYDEELMAWKDVIDVRHKGEKTSKGAFRTLLFACFKLTVRRRCWNGGKNSPQRVMWGRAQLYSHRFYWEKGLILLSFRQYYYRQARQLVPS